MWVVVRATYNFRYVDAVFGPFSSQIEAKQFQVTHNFGPHGSKVMEVRAPESYVKDFLQGEVPL